MNVNRTYVCMYVFNIYGHGVILQLLGNYFYMDTSFFIDKPQQQIARYKESE